MEGGRLWGGRGNGGRGNGDRGNGGGGGFAPDLHCAILKDILRKIWNEHYNL
jgi:hypothetical protein